MRAALSSARVRACALFSLLLTPFLPFLFVSFLILSLLFCSSPLGGFLPRRLSLTCRFLFFSTPGNHDFNLKQSNSYCECILSLSCPWHFLSDGTVEEKNIGRDKLMRKDRDLLVSAAKFSYILSYATDGSRILQIGNAPVCRLFQTLFAY